MFLTRMNSDRKLAALDSGEEGVIYVSRLQLAVEQILFARNYTIRLLDQTPVTEWFRQPPDGVSHIAWQVGHLAFAEYTLALEPIRGVQPKDVDLIPQKYLSLFGADSVPDPDPENYPNQAELRAVFDRVHEQVLKNCLAWTKGSSISRS
jgi:hypothetical protein